MSLPNPERSTGSGDGDEQPSGPRVAFACVWDSPPEATWSHTPWQLRRALEAHCLLENIDLGYPAAVRSAFRLAYARPSHGQIRSMWKHSGPARAYNQVRLTRAARVAAPDAVLQIGDVGRTDAPFFLLQDLSYDMLLDLEQAPSAVELQFSTLRRSTLHRLRDRQRQLYSEATGVLAMSGWLARHLSTVSGVPADRVTVVHPGATAVATDQAAILAAADRRLSRKRTRLLFVGRDFLRKGGREVVAALEILRRDVDPSITLTVVGPRSWPLDGAMPVGVNFLGPQSVERIATLFDEHDLFVLPSHFEAFGIVFAEALSRGLPCIGRDAFAMPEIIQAGVTGQLLVGNDPAVLADLLASTLADERYVLGARDDAARAASFYSWDRAARETVNAIRVGIS